MRLYLAGPMSNLPAFNFPAFHAAAKALRKKGHDVQNPAELAEMVGTDRPYGYYIRQGLISLLSCEAIVMLPGWEDSRGAKLEHVVAETIGLKVGEYMGDGEVEWRP